MFGYININQKELTEEGKKAYQAYYCGLCRQLKSNCGTKGQMLLAYDMTFLIVLLTGLYELPNEKTKFTCALHPTQKRIAWINDATKYAADMNLILAYHNLIDDWNDDRSYTRKAFAKMLDKDYTRIMSKYPRQVGAIEEYMKKTGRDGCGGVLLEGRRMGRGTPHDGILHGKVYLPDGCVRGL